MLFCFSFLSLFLLLLLFVLSLLDRARQGEQICTLSFFLPQKSSWQQLFLCCCIVRSFEKEDTSTFRTLSCSVWPKTVLLTLLYVSGSFFRTLAVSSVSAIFRVSWYKHGHQYQWFILTRIQCIIIQTLEATLNCGVMIQIFASVYLNEQHNAKLTSVMTRK